MSSTANATWRIPGVFAGACRLPPWVDDVWNFVSSSLVAVRGLQERDVCPDALESHDAVYPAALDRSFSLQLESKFDEELGCGCQVVNHDADVLHPLDRHALYGNESDPGRCQRTMEGRTRALRGRTELALKQKALYANRKELLLQAICSRQDAL